MTKHRLALYMKMKMDNDSRRQCRTTVGVREIRRDGPHRLTDYPTGVRSGDRNFSHDEWMEYFKSDLIVYPNE